MSSTYKRCVILYMVCLFCLMMYPYPVLFRTENNGFNARQNQSRLNKSPWYVPRLILTGCVMMLLLFILRWSGVSTSS
jgi:hypothetical protein